MVMLKYVEVFIGISGQHTKADFARAVIEGITYSLYDSIKIMRRAGHEMNSITSIGGGAKSRFWLQLQADIFNLQIRRLKHEEGKHGSGNFSGIRSRMV